MGAVQEPLPAKPAVMSKAGVMHGYAFDPTHGYRLDDLLKVGGPDEAPDYVPFWQMRRAETLAVDPKPRLRDTGEVHGGWRVLDLVYTSTGCTKIQGWALVPVEGPVVRGLVVGHGYGGRVEPDFDIPVEDAVIFFPCARGLGRSWHPAISDQPHWHVLHEIESRHRYVLGGCVDDFWLAVSSMLMLFPQVAGHIGYMGISFGGGVGTMAAAWEDRLQRVHLNVPTFGNQPLRMKLPTVGSAASVQQYVRQRPQVLEVLRYYDAAVAARHVRMPVHAACAVFDPAVAPAGQFAIFNSIPSEKQLFVLEAGHHAHPRQDEETARLRQELHTFFAAL